MNCWKQIKQNGTTQTSWTSRTPSPCWTYTCCHCSYQRNMIERSAQYFTVPHWFQSELTRTKWFQAVLIRIQVVPSSSDQNPSGSKQFVRGLPLPLPKSLPPLKLASALSCFRPIFRNFRKNLRLPHIVFRSALS